MKRFAFALALIALALASPGCAALRNLFKAAFQKPELRFKTFALREISLAGAGLDTVWSLENPNPIGLSLAEIDYAFFVEGKQVVAGRPRDGLRIPATGTADLTFPADVKFLDLAPALGTFLQKDVAGYRAEGTLGVQTPIGVLRFPLRHEGTFEVPKIPALAFEPPRLKSMGLSGAQLEIPLTLTNRNSFPLPVGGIAGNLSIGGARVGSVSTGNLGLLQGRATQTVTLPIQVNFASALQAANAIRQGRGQIALTGELQSGVGSVPISLSEVESFIR
jgi:LEA14-like dessication related protein